MLPPALGNPGPRHRLALTVPPGPRRVTDDGERARFHVAAIGKALPPHRRPPVALRHLREILVVKLDFIGDWVLTTPFLENLRLNAPQARITAVVLDRVFDLAACPFVDRVISVSRAERRRIVFGAESPTTLAWFRDAYLGRAFDLAVVPRWDADFNGALQIAFGSRAAAIVGFSEKSTPRKRRLNRGDDRFYTHALADGRLIHEADRDLFLIKAMRGRVASRGVTVRYGAGDEARAERFLGDTFGRSERRLLAIAPFGSELKKTLPADILARVVRRLTNQFDLDVVVIGSPGNAEDAAPFVRDLGERAVSAAGPLGTRETAALLARAAAFIGMDSGPAHIAAAVGTPVAVVFCHPANGSPDHTYAPERFAPRGRHVRVIQPARATPPCVEGCEADEAHCILALTEDVLRPQLERFVSAALRTRSSSVSGRARARRL
jgi:heptosyltransferase-2